MQDEAIVVHGLERSSPSTHTAGATGTLHGLGTLKSCTELFIANTTALCIRQKLSHTVSSRSGYSNVWPQTLRFARWGIYKFILVQVVELLPSLRVVQCGLMLPMPPPGNTTELGVPRKNDRKVFFSFSVSLFLLSEP